MEMDRRQEPISLNGISAVIFDLDGTIVPNARYHDAAWKKFFNKHRLQKPKEIGRASDRSSLEILRRSLGGFFSDEVLQDYSREKEQIYRELYEGHIKEVDGLSAILQGFKSRGIKVALAAVTSKENREFVLKGLNLDSSFDVVVGDEEVEREKPDPDIYLLTARKLEVAPEECLVFEDSREGIFAAKNAGMRVVGIYTGHQIHQSNQVERVYRNFSQINLS